MKLVGWYMRLLIVVAGILVSNYAAAIDVVELWPGEPPHSKPNSLEEAVIESWGVPCVKNVTHPTLTIHPARGENSGRAMIIFPGGGYEVESFVAEGRSIAEFLASQGVTAAVLKYRLPLEEASDQPWLLPITDARRAISLMKSLSGTYGFDPKKVGVMGFSAGGHLAASVSVLRSGHESENPDFSGLIYGVTTISSPNRQWLEETLYHRTMTDEEIRQYSLVDHVDERTPSTFLLHAFDDEVVPISESVVYAEALTTFGRDVEMHFFARGGHGFGPGRAEDGTEQWLGLLADWIKRQ
jgi:acetyl esterase/lipase